MLGLSPPTLIPSPRRGGVGPVGGQRICHKLGSFLPLFRGRFGGGSAYCKLSI